MQDPASKYKFDVDPSELAQPDPVELLLNQISEQPVPSRATQKPSSSYIPIVEPPSTPPPTTARPFRSCPALPGDRPPSGGSVEGDVPTKSVPPSLETLAKQRRDSLAFLEGGDCLEPKHEHQAATGIFSQTEMFWDIDPEVTENYIRGRVGVGRVGLGQSESRLGEHTE